MSLKLYILDKSDKLGINNSTIYSYLNGLDSDDKEFIIKSIANIFDFNLIKAREIYYEWKREYMKPKFEVSSKRGGWSIKNGKRI